MWAFYLYPKGNTLDHRWAFLCFLVGRFTEHFRRTDLFQRAVGPGVSVLRVCGSLGWAWTGIFGKGRQRETAALAGFLHHLDYPFLFSSSSSLFSFIFHTSISHIFSSKHYMYYVSHRCSRWISGSALGERPGPVWGDEVSTLEYHK